MTYHLFSTKTTSREQWVSIVVFGIHSHCARVNQTRLEEAMPIVHQEIGNDDNISTKDLCAFVENSLGARTPANAIAKIKYQLKQSLNHFGQSFDSLTK